MTQRVIINSTYFRCNCGSLDFIIDGNSLICDKCHIKLGELVK